MEALEAVLEGKARAESITAADVLDAWYPPSPRVVEGVRENLELLILASPPTHGDGLRSAIAGARGVDPAQVLVGSGSSSLMFLAIPKMVSEGDRAVVLDPMYGEYAHILENLVGARVERFELPLDSFSVDVEALAEFCRGAKFLAMVNPNSPTGVALGRTEMRRLLDLLEPTTKVWVDETYIDFLSLERGTNESVEELTGEFANLTVSKSMSKFYALSGVRVGYLVGDKALVSELDLVTPPWSVGTLATVAAERALEDTEYYVEKVAETARLRAGLIAGLEEVELVERVVPGTANFVLVPLKRAVARELCKVLGAEGIYLRDCASLSDRFHNETVRISVLSEEANRRVCAAIAASGL